MKLRYTVTFTVDATTSEIARTKLATRLIGLESDDMKYLIHPRTKILKL